MEQVCGFCFNKKQYEEGGPNRRSLRIRLYNTICSIHEKGVSTNGAESSDDKPPHHSTSFPEEFSSALAGLDVSCIHPCPFCTPLASEPILPVDINSVEGGATTILKKTVGGDLTVVPPPGGCELMEGPCGPIEVEALASLSTNSVIINGSIKQEEIHDINENLLNTTVSTKVHENLSDQDFAEVKQDPVVLNLCLHLVGQGYLLQNIVKGYALSNRSKMDIMDMSTQLETDQLENELLSLTQVLSREAEEERKSHLKRKKLQEIRNSAQPLWDEFPDVMNRSLETWPAAVLDYLDTATRRINFYGLLQLSFQAKKSYPIATHWLQQLFCKYYRLLRCLRHMSAYPEDPASSCPFPPACLDVCQALLYVDVALTAGYAAGAEEEVARQAASSLGIGSFKFRKSSSDANHPHRWCVEPPNTAIQLCFLALDGLVLNYTDQLTENLYFFNMGKLGAPRLFLEAVENNDSRIHMLCSAQRTIADLFDVFRSPRARRNSPCFTPSRRASPPSMTAVTSLDPPPDDAKESACEAPSKVPRRRKGIKRKQPDETTTPGDVASCRTMQRRRVKIAQSKADKKTKTVQTQNKEMEELQEIRFPGSWMSAEYWEWCVLDGLKGVLLRRPKVANTPVDYSNVVVPYERLDNSSPSNIIKAWATDPLWDGCYECLYCPCCGEDLAKICGKWQQQNILWPEETQRVFQSFYYYAYIWSTSIVAHQDKEERFESVPPGRIECLCQIDTEKLKCENAARRLVLAVLSGAATVSSGGRGVKNNVSGESRVNVSWGVWADRVAECDNSTDILNVTDFWEQAAIKEFWEDEIIEENVWVTSTVVLRPPAFRAPVTPSRAVSSHSVCAARPLPPPPEFVDVDQHKVPALWGEWPQWRSVEWIRSSPPPYSPPRVKEEFFKDDFTGILIDLEDVPI